MSAVQIRVAAVLALTLATGCVSMPQPPPGYPANQAIVAPQVNFVLPPPATLGQTVSVAQTIVSRFRGQSFAIDAQVQITPDSLDFVAMDGFGRRALTIAWRGGDPVYQPASWLPPMLRPANILADFVICYWPDAAVAEAIKGSGATLVTINGKRKIMRGTRELIVVEYGPGNGWNRAAKLRNIAFGYEIDVQSAEN
jgi:hypothetical protein